MTVSNTHTDVKEPSAFLKVEGRHIVQADQTDKPILLRGAGLGGWMNM